MLPLLPIPIVPEHIWKDVSEKDIKSYAAEPTDGQPVVGSGPVPAGRGHRRRLDLQFEANPDYWKGAPHVDEVVFRVFKSEDPMVQALIKGEIDFVDDISALQVQSLEGEEGITAHNGDSPGFDEIAFNTGSIDLETGEPIGDPNPAVLDPAFRFALNFAIDREQMHPHRLPGGRPDRHHDHPAGLPRLPAGPPDDPDAFAFDLDKAGQLLDEAGYTVGRRRQAHAAVRRAHRQAAARRAQRLGDVLGRHAVLPGVAGRASTSTPRWRPTSPAS